MLPIHLSLAHTGLSGIAMARTALDLMPNCMFYGCRCLLLNAATYSSGILEPRSLILREVGGMDDIFTP